MSYLKEIPRTGCRSGSGFSLLELVVVITIISILLVVAIAKLWAVQVDAERVAMDEVVGGLRSAIGIDVASYLVTGDFAGLQKLEGTNPMDRLAQVPKNYLGTLNGINPADMVGGAWYFDTQNKTLVYQVRNQDYFRGGFGKPARVRFKLQVVYEARGQRGVDGMNENEIAGATLVALDPYEWIYKE